MRVAHWLRENKGARLPNLLISFDTETDSIPIEPNAVEARLRFGWVQFTRRHRGLRWTPPYWRRFTDPRVLWEEVEEAIPDRWRAVMVAHNVGFDMRVCDGFRILPEMGWQLRGAVIDDPPTILRWRKGRKSLLILDSLNYYRSKLADIGNEIGLPKLGSDGEPDEGISWDDYCRRDVEIVAKAMQLLMRRVRQWDLGNFSVTLPSQAFTAWRHRHLSTPILIDDDDRALTLARQAFHGGRTEAYRVGDIEGPVDIYDFSSMYPAVMADSPMPTILRGVYRTMTIRELTKVTVDMVAVADVDIATDEPTYPLVHGGRLIFPVGKFRAPLCGPELRHALQHERVTRIHRVALYDGAVIFRSYIDEWWSRRLQALQEGRPADAFFSKLMMNALYGKLGQKGRVWEQVGESNPAEARTWLDFDYDTKTVRRFRTLSGLLQELRADVESRDSHPAIAAVVTSAGRMMLWQAMVKAQRAHVAYCDTDSLFLTHGATYPRTSSKGQPKLGELRRVRTLATLTIHGPKDYLADGERTVKGVRHNAEQLAPGVYRQDTFVGLKGAIAEGDISRQVIRQTTKVLRREYQKGVVMPSGHVRPYRFGPGGDLDSP